MALGTLDSERETLGHGIVAFSSGEGEGQRYERKKDGIGCNLKGSNYWR